ncbi:50S ribosomal protein L21 [Candidatus Marinamargulisbacteria bacterium SCGC AG-343-D04]|nr:50S ribosomal protein L21 [Candidatus Marinamargulisbacteria bacterium SCGC AG-343-D04]
MNTSKHKFAVIETGGKQYIVEEGSVISVEKLTDSDKKVVFSNVLLVFDNNKIQLGAPYLDSSVTAEVLSEEKDKKVRVFKFKKKTGYRKKQGHRQNYTTVRVVSIGSKEKASKAASTSKASDTKATKDKTKTSAEKKVASKKEKS